MQLSDSGVYTCVARSQAGLAELTYEVQVQGTIVTLPPDFPKSDMFYFEWEVFILVMYVPQCPQVWIMLNQWSQLQSSRGLW